MLSSRLEVRPVCQKRMIAAYLLVQRRVGHSGHSSAQSQVGRDPRTGYIAQDLSCGQHVDDEGARKHTSTITILVRIEPP